jgi:hypothetical protein
MDAGCPCLRASVFSTPLVSQDPLRAEVRHAEAGCRTECRPVLLPSAPCRHGRPHRPLACRRTGQEHPDQRRRNLRRREQAGQPGSAPTGGDSVVDYPHSPSYPAGHPLVPRPRPCPAPPRIPADPGNRRYSPQAKPLRPMRAVPTRTPLETAPAPPNNRPSPLRAVLTRDWHKGGPMRLPRSPAGGRQPATACSRNWGRGRWTAGGSTPGWAARWDWVATRSSTAAGSRRAELS